jgi:hypothetical protein
MLLLNLTDQKCGYGNGENDIAKKGIVGCKTEVVLPKTIEVN